MDLKPTLSAVADMTRRARAAQAETQPTADSLLDSIGEHMGACEVAADATRAGGDEKTARRDADAFLDTRSPDLGFSAEMCGLDAKPSRAAAEPAPSDERSARASALIMALRAGRLQG